MHQDADSGVRVAYIIGTYPLLTTTFIDREIRLLREWGLQLDIYAIRQPVAPLSPEQIALQTGVTYLLPVRPLRLLWAHAYFLRRRALVMVQTLFFLLSRRHPGWKARLKSFLHFVEGVWAAYLLAQNAPDRLHAHFVDRATTVALVAGRLLDIPYSATAHANDIYVNPVLLPEKIAGAGFIATCTGYNEAHLQAVAAAHLPDEAGYKVARIRRIYHGLELERYTPPPRSAREGAVRLLAVGQLKEKKGFTHLIAACRLLQERGYAFACDIVGEGPLRERLQAEIDQAGLANVVTLCGALPHEQVVDHYRQADLFALPCVVGADGDRDGIPNVILEAMAMGLPVVSTDHSGIPEAVEDQVTGLLVRPGDEEALADALARLFDCPDLRLKMGMAGRRVVEETFSVEANVAQLLDEFVGKEPSVGALREAPLHREPPLQQVGEPTDALRSALFLVWGPPSHGPRSRVFAREAGIGQLRFVYSTMRRGLLAAPMKYSYQTVATLRLLWRLCPRLIFVQSPPSIAVLVVYSYRLLRKSHFIVDAHSDAFTSPYWSRPRWLQRFLARRALTTIVTNEHFQQQIESWGGRAFILRDIPTSFPSAGGFSVAGAFNVAVINTFAEDEPLQEVLQAAEALAQEAHGVHFYITGKTARAPQPIAARLSPAPGMRAYDGAANVHFTDFLPDDDYYALLNSADAVLCLTTRNHTMQRGACEALSLGKPIITSDWPLLKSYFAQGTVHVDNSAEGIAAGIREMAARYDEYQAGIRQLQKGQLQEWRDKMALLNRLITSAGRGGSRVAGERKGRGTENGTN